MLKIVPLGQLAPREAYLPTGEKVSIIRTGKEVELQGEVYDVVLWDRNKLGFLDEDDIIIAYQLLDPADNSFYDWSTQGYIHVTEPIKNAETDEVLYDPDISTQLPSLFHSLKLTIPEWIEKAKIVEKVIEVPKIIEKPKTIKIGTYEVPLWIPAFIGGLVITKSFLK